VKDRPSKVRQDDFGAPWNPVEAWGPGLLPFPESSQGMTSGRGGSPCLRRAGQEDDPSRHGRPSIKVGLSPHIIDLMERGIVRGLAMNGACVIHDTEVAMVGHTLKTWPPGLGRAVRYGG